MNELKIFTNSEFGDIRTTVVENEPYFMLSDVCQILEIKNSRDAKSRLKEDGVVTTDTIDSLGRTQQATFINESNLYKLIFQSRKPEAERFSDWVTGDILPTIRKHGGYLTPQKLQEVLCSPDTIIKLATDLKQELERREHAEALIEAQKPKVLFAESVMASDKSILMNELAKIICQNGYDIGQNRLYTWMVNNGYLFYRDGGYLPSQRAMDLKVFEIKKTTIELPDREPIVRNTIKITPKGQIYFVNKFLARKEAV